MYDVLKAQELNSIFLPTIPSTWPSRMAPAKGVEKKGCSAINDVVTGEDTINSHKRTHGVSGLQEVWPLDTQRNPEICPEGDGDSRCVH